MTIAIIDYGSGNLRSAAKAFERAADELSLNLKISVTSDSKEILDANRIILPGVGSFGDCLSGLKSVPGMIDALEETVINRKVPFLGICVGMQLMANRGFETGIHKGLGWISGDVVEILSPNLKVPHMGWNNLNIIKQEHPFFNGIKSGDHFYFVHSYQFKCSNQENILATTDYDNSIVSAIVNENCMGVQFHPEKSQSNGIQLISNFLKWKP